MSLRLSAEKPESSSRSILHWRESVTSRITALEKAKRAPVIAEFVDNFLEMYSKILADLSTRRDPHDPILCSLRSGRDYLALWADENGARDGNLDNIIDWSRRLHVLTVRLLIKVGDILIQSLLPRTLDAPHQLALKGKYKITVYLEHLKLLAQGNSNDDSDSDTEESISDAEAEEESLAQISQSLKVTVGCLIGIGPRLKDRTVERVEESLPNPIETPQWHASIPLIERIRRRYPDCNVDLATRLGEANWRRMEERKRRIEENEQLPEALLDLDFGPNAPEKTIHAPATFRDSGIGTSIPSTHSERAETVVSYEGAAGGSIRVPPPPKEARSCEGCGGLVQMSNMVKWKKHLFEDLQPYMCLYDNCQSNFSPFQTKAEWLNHFLVDHTRDGEHFECPLCKSDEPVDAMSTLKHLSRHLEEIALTALPIDCEYDDDIGDHVSQISSRLENSVHRRSPWDDPDPWVAIDQELLGIEVKVPQSEHDVIHSQPTPEQLRPRSMDHPGGFPCTECRAALPDQASLTKHIKQHHTRPFVCVFHFAGCASTFSNKNEWKRHVASQHLLLNYWLCQQDGCAKLSNTAGSLIKPTGTNRERSSNNSGSQGPCSSGLPNGALFNRKDLYTQHLRRMHSPPAVRKQAKAKKPVPEWEDHIRKCQTEAHKLRCALPDYMACPKPGCNFEAAGHTAWDERMEHMAIHLEKAAKGREAQIKFGGDNDPTLMNWANRPDVAVIKSYGPGEWALNNPLKPERSGKIQTQMVSKQVRDKDYDEKDSPVEIDE